MLEQDCLKSYTEVQAHFEHIKESAEDEEAEGLSNQSDEREYDDVLQLLRRGKDQQKHLQIPQQS